MCFQEHLSTKNMKGLRMLNTKSSDKNLEHEQELAKHHISDSNSLHQDDKDSLVGKLSAAMLMQNGNHNDSLRNDTIKHIIPTSKEQISAVADESISNNLKMDQGIDKIYLPVIDIFQ